MLTPKQWEEFEEGQHWKEMIQVFEDDIDLDMTLLKLRPDQRKIRAADGKEFSDGPTDDQLRGAIERSGRYMSFIQMMKDTYVKDVTPKEGSGDGTAD